MILNFNDFINEKYLEKYYAPLYHFTSIKNLLFIFFEGKLKGSIRDNSNTISLTRNKDLFKIKRLLSVTSNQVRIELNIELLKTRFKIKQYAYWNFSPETDPQYRDENEEIVEKDIPLKYFKKITFYKENYIPLLNPLTDLSMITLYKNNKILYYKNIFDEIKNKEGYLELKDLLLYIKFICDDNNIELEII